MNNKKIFCLLAGFIFSLSGIISAQSSPDDALNSITKAELKDHVYFLASDYMAGRFAPSAEYEIAAQYVASQFASAGVQPFLKDESGELSYFQEVPFIKTTYGTDIKWIIKNAGETREFQHQKDFKILFSRISEDEKLDLVFVGYGIEEPDYGWNDFEGLEVAGKMVIVLNGAPMKKGKPVLPEEIHAKYPETAYWKKLWALSRMGAKGVIMVDESASGQMYWDGFESRALSEKYAYQGPGSERNSRSRPSMYIVKPEVVDVLFKGQPYSPTSIAEKGLKNYSCFQLEGISIETLFEVIEEKTISSKNIVGFIPGTDPDLINEYITVGAHLDHVAPVDGQVRNGADDNASGSSGVIEVAEAMALNPGRRPLVFIAFTAEEMGLLGSKYFLNTGTLEKEMIKFNLNLDMIGRSSEENAETRAHYLVTHKKYLNELSSFVGEINGNTINYPLLYNNDQDSPGGSDHQTFISAGIPAFFFFSGVHEDLHKPGDDPDLIDYQKAESISRLAYLIVNELSNMDVVPTFLEE